MQKSICADWATQASIAFICDRLVYPESRLGNSKEPLISRIEYSIALYCFPENKQLGYVLTNSITILAVMTLKCLMRVAPYTPIRCG